MAKSLYDQELTQYARASRQELKIVERALTMHPWGNSLRESARLLAVRQLLTEKKT